MEEMARARQGETAWCLLALRPCCVCVRPVKVEKAGRDFVMQRCSSALILLITFRQLGAEAFFSPIQGPFSSPCLPVLASLSPPPPWLLWWKTSLSFAAMEEWKVELQAKHSISRLVFMASNLKVEEIYDFPGRGGRKSPLIEMLVEWRWGGLHSSSIHPPVLRQHTGCSG